MELSGLFEWWKQSSFAVKEGDGIGGGVVEVAFGRQGSFGAEVDEEAERKVGQTHVVEQLLAVLRRYFFLGFQL